MGPSNQLVANNFSHNLAYIINVINYEKEIISYIKYKVLFQCQVYQNFLFRNWRWNTRPNYSFPLLRRNISEPKEFERNFEVLRLFWNRVSRGKVHRSLCKRLGNGLWLGNGNSRCLELLWPFVTKNVAQKSEQILEGWHFKGKYWLKNKNKIMVKRV